MNQKGISTIGLIMMAVIVVAAIAYLVVQKKPSPQIETVTGVPTIAGESASEPASIPDSNSKTPPKLPTTSQNSVNYYASLPEAADYTVAYKGTKTAIDLKIYKSGDKYRIDNNYANASFTAPKEERQFSTGSFGSRCIISSVPTDVWRCAKTPNLCGDKAIFYKSIFDPRSYTEPFPPGSPYGFNKGFTGKKNIAGVSASCFEFQHKDNYIASYGISSSVCFHTTKFLVLSDISHTATFLSFDAVPEDTFNPPQTEASHLANGFCGS